MKMELIQPFINAADAVLAGALQCPTRIGGVSMEEQAYRRKGVAAMVSLHGDIEGRIVFDVLPSTAVKLAASITGAGVEPSDELVRETVCELANLVVGNAVTSLNDQGFRFKIRPPQFHAADQGVGGNEDTEALVMCFDTDEGAVHMNIAVRYNRRRQHDSD